MKIKSDLKRLYQLTQDHECGLIIATHNDYSDVDNKRRNVSLLAKLQDKGLSVRLVESSGKRKFFVIDESDCGKLKAYLTLFSKEFQQSTIEFTTKSGNIRVDLVIKGYSQPQGMAGKLGCHSFAIKDWKVITDDEFYRIE